MISGAQASQNLIFLRKIHGFWCPGPSQHNFPKENQAIQNLKAKPVEKKCIIKADKIPYGDYAVAAMHDENQSGNMDYNAIGLPKEKYGFSNNKRAGLFGPPNFKSCRFVIDKPLVKIKITLK